MESKQFPLAACLSITTGKMLCDFGKFQELAEWVAGHPIWTHEFAEHSLASALKVALLNQHPQLERALANDVTRENWQERLAGWEKEFGKTLEVRKGTAERTESPLESAKRIMPDKPVLAVPSPKQPGGE